MGRELSAERTFFFKTGLAAVALCAGIAGCSSDSGESSGGSSASAGGEPSGTGGDAANTGGDTGTGGASTGGAGTGTGGGLSNNDWAPFPGFTISGKDILDDEGNAIQLRGFGLGGWLMPEPYMISWDPGIATGPTQMRAATEAKIGKADSDAFWELYRNNHTTRADLEAVKQWGFNSIRLSFNANTLMPPEAQPAAAPYTYMESEFAWVDKAVQWASEIGLYVILDMHGAPGGQNGNQIISDSSSKALFDQSDIYLPRMVDLWLQLARRYRDNPWVVGYDIMNEPVTTTEFGAAANHGPILHVYQTVTDALRADGDEKVVVAEAGFYGMEFYGIVTEPMWDDNLILQFHAYPVDIVAGPPTGPFEASFGLGYAANVPMWYGEGGENSNYAMIAQMAEWTKTTSGTSYAPSATGWAWWTTKKVVGSCFAPGAHANPDSSPFKCPAPPEWDAICSAGAWNAADAETAKAGLMAMAAALETSGCERLDALVTALGGAL